MSTPASRLAAALRRRGLDLPGEVLLEAHRPLLPLLRQAGVALSPLLRPLLGPRSSLTLLLDDPEAYEQVLDELGGPPPVDGDRAEPG